MVTAMPRRASKRHLSEDGAVAHVTQHTVTFWARCHGTHHATEGRRHGATVGSRVGRGGGREFKCTINNLITKRARLSGVRSAVYSTVYPPTPHASSRLSHECEPPQSAPSRVRVAYFTVHTRTEFQPPAHPNTKAGAKGPRRH